MSAGFDRRGKSNAAAAASAVPHKPPPPDVPSTLTHSEARSAGYTGSVCDLCGSPRMKQAGHCLVCEDCGTTTGCS